MLLCHCLAKFKYFNTFNIPCKRSVQAFFCFSKFYPGFPTEIHRAENVYSDQDAIFFYINVRGLFIESALTKFIPFSILPFLGPSKSFQDRLPLVSLLWKWKLHIN